MVNDITCQQFPLPEDVLKLKMIGNYGEALKKIEYLIAQERTPAVLRERLELEKHVLLALQADQYPYTFVEAETLMRNSLRDYQEGELAHYRDIGAADWIFVDGQVRFNQRFFGNLASTRPEISDRLLVQDDIEETNRDQALRDEQVRIMAEQGGRSARITLHLGIKVKKEFERPGVPVLVHLPLPRECRQVSDFDLIAHGDGKMTIAAPEALQRTISFESVMEPDKEFWVEYRYVNHVDRVVPEPEKVTPHQPDFFLEEQAPHIMFTPYLMALSKDIVGVESNPLLKARKIYDFVTTHVMYSYVRRYDTIDDLSEYAAVNLKGDCGIQALLFITLCRICGVPARWQSGMYVTPDEIGPHDWAEFYVEPYGWMFCDYRVTERYRYRSILRNSIGGVIRLIINGESSNTSTKG